MTGNGMVNSPGPVVYSGFPDYQFERLMKAVQDATPAAQVPAAIPLSGMPAYSEGAANPSPVPAAGYSGTGAPQTGSLPSPSPSSSPQTQDTAPSPTAPAAPPPRPSTGRTPPRHPPAVTHRMPANTHNWAEKT